MTVTTLDTPPAASVVTTSLSSYSLPVVQDPDEVLTIVDSRGEIVTTVRRGDLVDALDTASVSVGFEAAERYEDAATALR